MAFTVTASMSSVSFTLGLKVLVLTGAIESGGANAGRANTSGAASASLTPNFTNALPVEGLINSSTGGTTFTAAASNTFRDNLSLTGNTEGADGSYTGTVTALSAVTVGSTAPTIDSTALAAYEVVPSGGTPLIDSSTPAIVSAGSSPVTTASFTPPAGAVLAAIVFGTPGSASTPSISDTSGLGLTWTQRAQFQSTAATASVSIFTATIAAATTPAATAPQPQPQWFPSAPSAPGGNPFVPWPVYEAPAVPVDTLAAAATVTATASATLVNAPAPWELPPQYAPGWFPGAPAVPATDPFTAWPLGETGVNSTPLTAPLTVTATGAAALTESKPLNAAATVTATGAAALTESKPLNAATTVTATAAASLGVVKAGVTPEPAYPPKWFPSGPGVPGGEPFAPWPVWTGLSAIAVPFDILNAPLTVTATGAAALTEAKPVNAATTVTATGAAALTESKPLNAAQAITAAALAALVNQGGLPPAVPQYAPAWFPSAPSAPGDEPFAPWPPWTGSPPVAVIPTVNATSAPTVTDPDTSAAGVTDPRDGTWSVTDLVTSAPGVSDG